MKETEKKCLFAHLLRSNVLKSIDLTYQNGIRFNQFPIPIDAKIQVFCLWIILVCVFFVCHSFDRLRKADRSIDIDNNRDRSHINICLDKSVQYRTSINYSYLVSKMIRYVRNIRSFWFNQFQMLSISNSCPSWFLHYHTLHRQGLPLVLTCESVHLEYD